MAESILKQDIVVKFGKVMNNTRMIHSEYLEASNENYPDAFIYLKKAKQSELHTITFTSSPV